MAWRCSFIAVTSEGHRYLEELSKCHKRKETSIQRFLVVWIEDLNKDQGFLSQPKLVERYRKLTCMWYYGDFQIPCFSLDLVILALIQC